MGSTTSAPRLPRGYAFQTDGKCVTATVISRSGLTWIEYESSCTDHHSMIFKLSESYLILREPTKKTKFDYPTADKGELWEVSWRPDQRTKAEKITKPSIIAQKIQQSSKPKGYVPPHARGRKDYNVSFFEILARFFTIIFKMLLKLLIFRIIRFEAFKITLKSIKSSI